MIYDLKSNNNLQTSEHQKIKTKYSIINNKELLLIIVLYANYHTITETIIYWSYYTNKKINFCGLTSYFVPIRSRSIPKIKLICNLTTISQPEQNYHIIKTKKNINLTFYCKLPIMFTCLQVPKQILTNLCVKIKYFKWYSLIPFFIIVPYLSFNTNYLIVVTFGLKFQYYFEFNYTLLFG
ncbi:hypothetical protein AGLY_005497 [Aphis glycines]|uniref:Uncharacterized protein n=1 Tax=Aphis glycines TaxID=307491 RepID=A0A6G0TU52_APHGL|nr:hypothetical protein AGLY_005497 [Aphis glycines]